MPIFFTEGENMSEFQLLDITDHVARKINERWHNNFHQQLPLGTGSGKTYMAIHACALFNPDAHLIVFAPKAKIEDDSWQQSIDSYNQVMQTHLTYTTVTYSKQKLQPIYEELKAHECNLLVLDEIHQIKSGSSKKSKRAQRLIDFSRNSRIAKSIGLSATAEPNNPFDACTYFIINGYYRNITEFRDTHVVRKNDYHMPIYENENDLKNWDLYEQHTKAINIYIDTSHVIPKIETRFAQIQLDDHYKYVHPVFNTEKNPFDDQEARTTKEHYKKSFWYFKKGWIESKQSHQKMLYDIIAHDPARKLTLYKFLQAIDGETPVIIPYQFKTELAAIEEVAKYAGYDLRYVNGQIKNVSETNRPKSNRTVIALQYDAGGSGIEFTYARYTIYYAPTFSYINYSQSKGRNVRAGMTGPVYHFYIATSDANDRYVWDTVINKRYNQAMVKDMAYDAELQQYVGNSRDDVTKDVML